MVYNYYKNSVFTSRLTPFEINLISMSPIKYPTKFFQN